MGRNNKISRDFYDAYNRRDWERLASMMSPTVEWFHAARHELICGVDAVVAMLRSSAESFPDARIQLTAVREAGDAVISEWRYESARSVKRRRRAIACDVQEMRDGKLVRGSTYGDTLQMLLDLEQGAAPIPAVPLAPVIHFAA